jgi:hypothetical protein
MRALQRILHEMWTALVLLRVLLVTTLQIQLHAWFLESLSSARRSALRIVLFLHPGVWPQELAQDRLLGYRAILTALRILLFLEPLARRQGHVQEAKSSREFAIRAALPILLFLVPLARTQELALGGRLGTPATLPALLTRQEMAQTAKQQENVGKQLWRAHATTHVKRVKLPVELPAQAQLLLRHCPPQQAHPHTVTV